MDRWEAFGQGGPSAAGIGDAGSAAAAAPAPAADTVTKTFEVGAKDGKVTELFFPASAAPATGAPSSGTVALALQQQPKQEGSGMDALLRAVIGAATGKPDWGSLAQYTGDAEFCRMADKRGCTPLHLAISHGAPLSVVESLLSACVPAAQPLSRQCMRCAAMAAPPLLIGLHLVSTSGAPRPRHCSTPTAPRLSITP